MKNIVAKKSVLTITLFVISALFVLSFAFCINPIITESLEVDASCFYVIGRDMLKGKMPYVDFVDNKGPITYIVYALSALLPAFPWGILLISILMVFISLLVINYICKKLNVNHPVVICLIYLFFYVCVCSRGGYTEDMALPLTLGAFAVLLYFEEHLQNKKRIIVSGFLYGILFWLCAFTRLNNAVTIGVLTAFSGIHILTQKKIKSFFTFVLSFLVGSIIVAFPILIWLLKNEALQEFLNQFIFNNFKYSSADTAFSKSSLFIWDSFGHKLYLLTAIGIISPLVSAFFRGQKYTPVTIATVLANAVSALSLYIVSNNFDHYLLVVLIPSFFSFILLFSTSKGEKPMNGKLTNMIAVMLCMAVLTTFTALPKFKTGAGYAVNFARATLSGTLKDMPENTDMGISVKKIADHIPENERDSVFSININPCFYAMSGISPYRRIFVCSSLFTSISDEYKKEFIEYFEDEPPKWLVTAKPLEDTEICDGLEKQLVEQYTPVDSVSERFYLYKLGE